MERKTEIETRHEWYNKESFNIFICNHVNWDIYAKENGYCAAIPTESARAIGCKSTHFGDINYVRRTLGVEVKI